MTLIPLFLFSLSRSPFISLSLSHTHTSIPPPSLSFLSLSPSLFLSRHFPLFSLPLSASPSLLPFLLFSFSFSLRLCPSIYPFLSIPPLSYLDRRSSFSRCNRLHWAFSVAMSVARDCRVARASATSWREDVNTCRKVAASSASFRHLAVSPSNLNKMFTPLMLTLDICVGGALIMCVGGAVRVCGSVNRFPPWCKGFQRGGNVFSVTWKVFSPRISKRNILNWNVINLKHLLESHVWFAFKRQEI